MLWSGCSCARLSCWIRGLKPGLCDPLDAKNTELDVDRRTEGHKEKLQAVKGHYSYKTLIKAMHTTHQLHVNQVPKENVSCLNLLKPFP